MTVAGVAPNKISAAASFATRINDAVFALVDIDTLVVAHRGISVLVALITAVRDTFESAKCVDAALSRFAGVHSSAALVNVLADVVEHVESCSILARNARFAAKVAAQIDAALIFGTRVEFGVLAFVDVPTNPVVFVWHKSLSTTFLPGNTFKATLHVDTSLRNSTIVEVFPTLVYIATLIQMGPELVARLTFTRECTFGVDACCRTWALVNVLFTFVDVAAVSGSISFKPGRAFDGDTSKASWAIHALCARRAAR